MADVTDVMRRMVKEQLVTMEGKPLFPERFAYTVDYTLSAEEARPLPQRHGICTGRV